MLWNEHSTEQKLPEDLSVNVDYTEMEYPSDPKVEQEVEQWELDHGLVNVAQLMLRRNPDLGTEEKALKEVERNLKTNRDLLEKKNQILKILQNSIKPSPTGNKPAKEGAPEFATGTQSTGDTNDEQENE